MKDILANPVVWILIAVLALIAIRRVGNVIFHIWQVMAIGAVAVLLTGSVTPQAALKAINFDVILFLAGMFVVAESLCLSGCLYVLSHRFFNRVTTTGGLAFMMLFSFAFFSALIMNDTVAIIGTPLALSFAQRHNIRPKLMLLIVCFSITIGSAASPIGNPQNLIIALSGIKNPFGVFVRFLFLPTVINLVLTYFVLRFFYKDDFAKSLVHGVYKYEPDDRLSGLSKLSLILIAVLIALKTIAFFYLPRLDFPMAVIVIIPALPLLIFSPRRREIAVNIDWRTLVFFAALFVLMQAVWDSGVMKSLMTRSGVNTGSIDVVLLASVFLSQILSNVPYVAMYLPLISGASSKALMALAAGSTIAGNMFILGAASNVIVIQNAEKRGQTLTFFEFARVGVPLTAINVLVYRVFLI